jgi:1,4-dihydroxy-2-naphthoate octaprenyltransferase
VGILPFILGTVLAWKEKDLFRWDICMWGVFGAMLVMLTTYYAGEYSDFIEDSLSARQTPSHFAGGSRALQHDLLPRRTVFWASLISLSSAITVGLILQFGYRTGILTIPLGILGIAGGFFYSTRPIRWVSTGAGELWIALCYGWLPIAIGYYLQAGEISAMIQPLAIPVGLTIFNVILLNEFPDYPADLEARKSNLTVRLGQERAAILYSLVGFGSWMALLLSLSLGVPLNALWLYVPIFGVSLVLVVLMLRGFWRERATLEKLCAANLIVNLSTTTVYILAFVT